MSWLDFDTSIIQPWPDTNQPGFGGQEGAATGQLGAATAAAARSGNHAEFLAGFDEGVDALVELSAGVGGADLGADAGLALRHNRIEKPDGIDAAVEELVGEALGEGGVT